jgi:hypothetical protein
MVVSFNTSRRPRSKLTSLYIPALEVSIDDESTSCCSDDEQCEHGVEVSYEAPSSPNGVMDIARFVFVDIKMNKNGCLDNSFHLPSLAEAPASRPPRSPVPRATDAWDRALASASWDRNVNDDADSMELSDDEDASLSCEPIGLRFIDEETASYMGSGLSFLCDMSIVSDDCSCMSSTDSLIERLNHRIVQ